MWHFNKFDYAFISHFFDLHQRSKSLKTVGRTRAATTTMEGNMEGTASGAGDREKDAAFERAEADDSGIRTEFERMMFEFNPEDSAPASEPEASPPAPQVQPEPDEPPAYD
jgi:hypothetical protein